MHMKEAAVNIDNFAVSNENDVWFPGKVCLMKSISITQAMHDGSNDHLRLRIAIPNTRHVEASLMRSVNVGHYQK